MLPFLSVRFGMQVVGNILLPVVELSAEVAERQPSRDPVRLERALGDTQLPTHVLPVDSPVRGLGAEQPSYFFRLGSLRLKPPRERSSYAFVHTNQCHLISFIS